MTEFKVKDKVELPFNETGIIIKIEERIWASKFYVKIIKSNGFNNTNQVVDFLEKDLKLII